MPVVDENQHVEALKKLGVPDPIIRLATGENLHKKLQFRCGRPSTIFDEEADPPDGPVFVPIFECEDMETGAWIRDGQLEFIDFDIESPDDFDVISKSVQGMLAHLFITLYEDEEQPEDLTELRDAASAVGFKYLDEVVEAYQTARPRTMEAFNEFHDAFIQKTDEIENGT